MREQLQKISLALLCVRNGEFRLVDTAKNIKLFCYVYAERSRCCGDLYVPSKHVLYFQYESNQIVLKFNYKELEKEIIDFLDVICHNVSVLANFCCTRARRHMAEMPMTFPIISCPWCGTSFPFHDRIEETQNRFDQIQAFL